MLGRLSSSACSAAASAQPLRHIAATISSGGQPASAWDTIQRRNSSVMVCAGVTAAMGQRGGHGLLTSADFGRDTATPAAAAGGLDRADQALQSRQASSARRSRTMAAVPLLVYAVSGKWFVRGIAAGAVKG